jgi:hypothetical protein
LQYSLNALETSKTATFCAPSRQQPSPHQTLSRS